MTTLSRRAAGVGRRVRRRWRIATGTDHPRVRPWMVREWSPADLRPLPEGTEAGTPHFVGVGVPKAGTTWWFDLLTRHPAVLPNRFGRKELQFFCRTDAFGPDVAADRDLYRRAFPRGVGFVSGEWTPNYLSYPYAVERLVDAAPGALVLVVVRDPVDRFASHLNHHAELVETLGLRGDEAAFLWRYFLYPDAVRASCVAEPLGRLFALVPREQVIVLQYERCREQPEDELRRTFAFLGIDPDTTIPAVREPVNARAARVPRLEPHERDRAAAWFAEELQQIRLVLPDLDLDRWRSARAADPLAALDR